MKSHVKKVMEQKGVTLRRLEEDSGLSHVTILSARSDEKILKCQLGTLAKMAAALGVSTKDLYDEDGETTD
ncbi:MAG: helix-turn-helix transcriptional regulator [Desulfovermiculus sp.]|nr:helix-turn-helix transcriptional regulator [Desulfovermiculus sp.]